MEFISLAETVALIAEKIDLPPRFGGVFDRLQFNETDGKYVENFLNANNIHVEWARKYSIAAKWLNQELHTSKNKKPTWLIHDEDMQITIENEAIRDEAIKLLSHAMKWGNYRDTRCDAILYNAHSSGRFDLLPSSRIEDEEGKHVWPDGSILRAHNIKFRKDEIFDFLKNCDIDYSTKATTNTLLPRIIISNMQQDEKIPGKIPRVAMNKIAIKAAWLIENECGRPATNAEVMGRLSEWAKTGADEGEGLLLGFDHTKGIKHRKRSKAKDGFFSNEACSKAIVRWNESRNSVINPAEVGQ